MLSHLTRTFKSKLFSRLYSTEIKRTGLYEFHLENGAKMLNFGGYRMPLNYPTGSVAEHHQVRNSCGLFDVGHMVQSTFKGEGVVGFLSMMLPSSIATMENSNSSLSTLLNEQGGIIDDCMITRWSENEFYLVTNAGRRSTDLAWLNSHVIEWNFNHKEQVEMKILENQGLLAIQGPKSSESLSKLISKSFSLSNLYFGQSIKLTISGMESQIQRGGYSGEDGFELSVLPKDTVTLAKILLDLESVKLAGLAARDSLRLEAGLCLYGHDLDESIGLGEAGLGWIVGKDRRNDESFIGSKRTLGELKKGGISRKRIGLIIESGPAAREGTKIFNSLDSKNQIGIITSGLPSPTLKLNISMGYIETKNELNKKGSQVFVEVRGKRRKAKVVGMPFPPFESKYYRG